MKCPITYFLFLASLLGIASVTNAQVGASTSYAQTTVNQPVVVNVAPNTYNGASFFDRVVLADNCIAQLNADGTLSVVPNRDFVGVASINYTVCADATRKDCTCGLATVQVNNDPTPMNDGTTVFTEKNQNSKFTIPLVFAFDGRVTTPHGILLINANGIVTYRPALGYAGLDTYILNSASGNSHYELDFEVFTSPAQNTFVKDDYESFAPGAVIKINIFINDKLAGVNLATYTPSNFVNGYVTGLDSNGIATFVLENPSFQGVASFSYSLTNSLGVTETGTVHITVSNFAPAKAVYDVYVPSSGAYQFAYNSLAAAKFNLGTGKTLNGGTLIFANNVFTYTPLANATTDDQINIKYCLTADCSSYNNETILFHLNSSATCTKNCVFPGDANNDGTVNMLDLFPIAANIGTYGAARTDNDALNWYGRTVTDWKVQDITSSNDLKFVDSNGDGIISADDTTALVANYSNTSRLAPTSLVELGGVSMQLLTPFGSVQPGDMVEIALSVGSKEQPVFNTKGLSFSVNYDSKKIKENSITVGFNKFSWLSHTNAFLSLSKVVQRGTVDAALVRTRNSGSTGHGEIGKIRGVVIEDVAGISQGNQPTVRFTVSDIYTEDANGVKMLIKGGSIDIPIVAKSANTVLQNSDLHVFPNPSSAQANFYLNGENALSSVRLVDISGKTISEFTNINSKQFSISLSGVASGLYIVDVRTDKGRITQKLQVSE